MSECDFCGRKGVETTGAILNGKFGQACRACRTGANRLPNGGAAQSARDADRRAHARDLIQPWDSRGAPNKDFIQNYPEEAHDIFTEDELKQYG